jgi:hypothetical protein
MRMTEARHRLGLIAFIAAMVHASPQARAVEPAQLVDRELASLPIQFVSLSPDRLSYFDSKRQLQETSLRPYVSLRFSRDPIEPSARQDADSADPAGTLELVDGHLLPGRFAGVDAEGRLLWKTESFGVVALPLDRLVAFDKAAAHAHADDHPSADAPAAAPDPAADHVTLLNGDRLAGFIEKIDEGFLSLQVNGQSLALPWDRVAAVRLSNPPKPAPGLWAQLEDGSRLLVDNATMDQHRLTGKTLGDRKVDLPAALVLSIDFAQRHRLIRLAELDWAVAPAPAGVFGVVIPPVLAADHARLHAPLTLRFDLPAGTRRVAFRADIEQGSTDWADMVLHVADGKGSLFSQRLNAQAPMAQVNIAPRDRQLILHLDEAVNGPIRDRLELTDAVVLVEFR